jgi:hypothetical protein
VQKNLSSQENLIVPLVHHDYKEPTMRMIFYNFFIIRYLFHLRSVF